MAVQDTTEDNTRQHQDNISIGAAQTCSYYIYLKVIIQIMVYIMRHIHQKVILQIMSTS